MDVKMVEFVTKHQNLILAFIVGVAWSILVGPGTAFLAGLVAGIVVLYVKWTATPDKTPPPDGPTSL